EVIVSPYATLFRSWAFAVFVGVAIAGPYSCAHLNCAVTAAVYIIGDIDLATAGQYILAHMIGSMIGACIVWVVYKDHYDRTEDTGAKQAVFCTAPAIRNLPINCISAVVGTCVLVFVILHFQAASIDESTPIGLGTIGAIPVTFLVWVIGLSLGGTTGYAINPARDLGPRIVHALLPMRNKAAF